MADHLQALAASRQAGEHPATSLELGKDDQNRLRATLRQTAAGVDSSAAVSTLLLSAFAEATTSSARARSSGQGHSLLPRAVEIEVLGGGARGAAPAPAPGTPEQQPQQPQQQEALCVQFTATDPEAGAQVAEAARLFEAFWQFHVKAAKSDLHCRMRQRLTALQQQLRLARFDGE